jgi:hypothetical protein
VSNIVPNPGAVVEAVSQEPGAIGYLPESWLETTDPQVREKVKELRLNDQNEGEITIPILAYLRSEPDGGVRELLFCLQEQ